MKYQTLPETQYEKVSKTQENITHTREPKSQISPAGDHWAARIKQDRRIKTITKRIQKRSTAFVQSVRG